MYEVIIPVRAHLLPGEQLFTAADRMTASLADTDAGTPELLDYAVGADASNSTITAELTVEAADGLDAMAIALGWVRSAIRAAEMDEADTADGLGVHQLAATA